MDKREMLSAVPSMRYAVRVRHAQTGSALTANSYYASLNEDALAIVNLIDGSRSIKDIANEICTNKKLSSGDRPIVADKVLHSILEMWKTGLFLEGDLDSLAPRFLYQRNNITYIPYYAKAAPLRCSYLSPIVDGAVVQTVNDISDNFGSSSVVLELCDGQQECITQVAFVRTVVEGAYFLYSIFGTVPNLQQWLRIRDYMVAFEPEFKGEATQEDLSGGRMQDLNYLIYSVCEADRRLLPPTLSKGVIPNELMEGDVEIRELQIDLQPSEDAARLRGANNG